MLIAAQQSYLDVNVCDHLSITPASFVVECLNIQCTFCYFSVVVCGPPPDKSLWMYQHRLWMYVSD